MNKLITNFTGSVSDSTIFIYLINVIFISLIYNNLYISIPILASLIFFGGLIDRSGLASFLKASLVIFFVTIVFNLLINQRGEQLIAQFWILKLTQESLTSAVSLGISFLNILWSFYIYNKLVNTKLMFDLISKVSRNIAIIFVLTVKFIPRIINMFRQVGQLLKFRKQNQLTGIKSKVNYGMFLNEIVLNKSIASFMNMSDSLITKGYGNKNRLQQHTAKTNIDRLFQLIIYAAILFNVVMISLGIGQINLGSANIKITFDISILTILVINLIVILYPLMIGGSHFLWWKLYVSKTTASDMPTAKKFR